MKAKPLFENDKISIEKSEKSFQKYINLPNMTIKIQQKNLHPVNNRISKKKYHSKY